MTKICLNSLCNGPQDAKIRLSIISSLQFSSPMECIVWFVFAAGNNCWRCIAVLACFSATNSLQSYQPKFWSSFLNSFLGDNTVPFQSTPILIFDLICKCQLVLYIFVHRSDANSFPSRVAKGGKLHSKLWYDNAHFHYFLLYISYSASIYNELIIKNFQMHAVLRNAI